MVCIENIIERNGIDFIDFGCSKGGSIDFAMKRFGGRAGLGIDTDIKKVDATSARGYHAIKLDILSIPDKKLVDFVIMSHILEHLPTISEVTKIVKKACSISREFVYIQQPFFDADGYLLSKQLKLFWSDWRGHPSKITSLQLFQILRDLKVSGMPIEFSIHYYKRILSSSDDAILPISTLSDQSRCSPTIQKNKDCSISFDNVEIYHELIALATFEGVDHQEMIKKLRISKTIYPSI